MEKEEKLREAAKENSDGLWPILRQHEYEDCLVSFAKSEAAKEYHVQKHLFLGEMISHKIRVILSLHLNNFYNENKLSIPCKVRTKKEDEILKELIPYLDYTINNTPTVDLTELRREFEKEFVNNGMLNNQIIYLNSVFNWFSKHIQPKQDNYIELKNVWEMACKAQMNLVFEHCQHSPQGTNGHAIKHWVKIAEIPNEFPKQDKESEWTEIKTEDDLPEEDENVIWWKVPVCEPPYIGCLLETDFPHGYYTHWQPLPTTPNNSKTNNK